LTFSTAKEALQKDNSPSSVTSLESTELRPGLALLSVCAVFCLTLELLTAQQLDSLRTYMLPREIMLDAGVALLLVLGFAFAWWLLILIIGTLLRAVPVVSRFAVPVSWFFWIAPPVGYFVARLSGAVRMEVAPSGRISPLVESFYVFALLAAAIWAIRALRLSGLQNFFRSRMAPVAWLHVGLAIGCLLVLWSKGVYFFRNYQLQPRSVDVRNLPDVYLVTVDALRADATSLYGYSQPTTPNLERFAARSYTFDQFFANSNFTTSATASIETGKFPWTHRVFSYGGFLNHDIRQQNLAGILHEHGYYTTMISSNFRAAPFQHRTLGSYDAVQFAGPSGIEGMWLRYTNLIGTNAQYTLAYSILQRLYKPSEDLDAKLWPGRYLSPADDVFAKARAILDRPGISQPQFMWTHIYPPHDPYWPPSNSPSHLTPEPCKHVRIISAKKLSAGTTASQLRSCYDQMVQYADREVGGFLDWLDKTGRLEHSIVIISSDHGESFEDNWFVHGGPRLQSGLIQVPLLVHLPGQQSGTRIPQPAEQVDILPTVLDAVGIPIPAWAEGVSLLPATRGQKLADHYIFSMNLETEPAFSVIKDGTFAIADNDFKLVSSLSTGKQALYRYRTDFGEQHDLLESEPDAAQRLSGALVDKLKNVNESFAEQQHGRQ
jgi:arylsulfatase A-like enzyme